MSWDTFYLSTSPMKRTIVQHAAFVLLAAGARWNSNWTVSHEPTILGQPKWPCPSFLGKSHRQEETVADVQGKAVLSIKNFNKETTYLLPYTKLSSEPKRQRFVFPSFRLAFVDGSPSWHNIRFLFSLHLYHLCVFCRASSLHAWWYFAHLYMFTDADIQVG